MAALIGAVRVDMGLDSAQFEMGTKKARATAAATAASMDKSFKGAATNIKSSFGGISSSIAGGIAAIGIAGIAAAGKAVLDFADNLSTAADQAGISVERFQTLREGFRVMEVDAEKFENGLKRLVDTLGAVQSGTAAKGVVDVLDRMGITTKILSGQITTADQLLDAIAKSAGGFKSEAEFTSAVVDLLGRKIGVDFAAALKDGGTALHGIEQQMRDTGQVIDKEMIQRLADANESIDAFQERASRQFAIMAANSISSLDELALKLYKVARQVNQFNPFDPNSVADYDKAIGEIRARQDNSPAHLRGLSDAVKAQHKKVLTARTNPGRAQEAKELRQMIAELETATVRFRGAQGLGGNLDLIAPPKRTTFDPPKKDGAGRSKSPAAKAAEETTDALAETVEQTRIAIANFETMDTTALGAFNTAQKAAEEQARVDVGLAEQVNAIDANSERMGQAWEESFAKAREEQKRFIQDLSDGLAGAIVYGDRLGDVLGNIFKRLAYDNLSKSISEFFGSVGLGSGGGGGGGGLLGGIAKGIGSIFGGPRAAGGPVAAGKAYLVGERGPELFMPRISGSIASNLTTQRLAAPSHDANHSRVSIVPSPYFDAVVDGRAARVAAPMAQQAMIGGSASAQAAIARRGNRRLA